MTDLTNDASLNLSSGAAGGTTSTFAPTPAPVSEKIETSQFSAAAAEQASKVQQLAADTARQLEDKAAQAREWAMTQSDVVRTKVEDKPFASIGTAFAAGIIFGMLLRR